VVEAALLAGRYRLIEPIGRGGMAEVWRAEDVALDRPVAIKLRTVPGPAAGGTAAGVWQEARDAAQLVHPNVVGIYDVAADGDRLFLVMELIEGRDLAALLAEHGPLPYARVAQIGAQAARALAATHAAGVVHRDVKPGNLLVTPDGTVKLTDFGIAGPTAAANNGAAVDDVAMDTNAGEPAADAADANRAVLGLGSDQLLGTSAYVAPERVAGFAAGPASDLYSLGCVLYELLVGHPPFPSDDPEQAVRRHLLDEPEPPGRVRPGIPAELEQTVLRLLAKEPADRPEDAERVALVLQAVTEEPAHPSPPEIEAAAESAITARVPPTHAPGFLYHDPHDDPHDDQEHGRDAGPEGRRPPTRALRRTSQVRPLIARLGNRPRLVSAAGVGIIAAVAAAVVTLLGPGNATLNAPAAASSPVTRPPTAGKTGNKPPDRSRPLTPAALLSALDQRLARQATTGHVDPKTADDLRRRIRQIADRLADHKPGEAADTLREIRKKLGEAAHTGKWTPDPITTRLLNQLATTL
jgi:serine/threonine protein kinase